MIKDLVTKSRSYRGYNSERKLTKEELLDLVDCARLCPSSVNIQPLKFYIAWKDDEVAKIQPLTQWAKALKDITLPHERMCPTAFIVICHDTDICPPSTANMRDVGITAQTMLLAATEKGLGGCMIGSFDSKGLKEVLHLADNLEPRLVVALGEPAEKVVLTEVGEDGSTTYYRDENDVHYVPKRKLEDIVLCADEA